MPQIRAAYFLLFILFATSCDRSADLDLQEEIESGIQEGIVTTTEVRLFATDSLESFYRSRDFEPVWVDAHGITSSGRDLVESLSRSGVDGLDPDGYRSDEIAELIDRVDAEASSTNLAALELMLSDAFMAYGSHLYDGKINPETRQPEWPATHGEAPLVAMLEDAVQSSDIAETIESYAPPQDRYHIMKAQMIRLEELSREDWEEVPAGGKIELGSTGPRVAIVRSRLELWGDVAPNEDIRADSFDVELQTGLRQFQARHGLETDGVFGPATLRALNASPVDRMRQLAVNMERWRRLPADLGSRYIEVNIAGFMVNVVEDGEIVQTHRAVVGQQYRQTPTFSATMEYLVLAPYWNVPASIAGKDKLPVIKNDPAYLDRQRMKIFRRDGNAQVAPSDIDWSRISEKEFNDRYWLRQEPGPLNALGNIKFMFPNKHNVYLHDTPSRELFNLASRSFSSGCIRVENPLDLAEYLLKADSSWNRDRMMRVINEGVEVSVPLPEPVPVHLLYWTAWVDSDGVLQFREDIYNRDAPLWDALMEDPPAS